MELLSVIHSSLSRVYVHMEPLGLVCHDQIRQRCIVFLLISLAYLCVIHVKSVKNKRHEADQLIDWTNLPQWQLTHSACLRRTCLETLCGFPPTYVKLNLLFARPYAVNYAFSGRDEWLTGDRNGNERIKKHFAYARVKPDTRERHTRTVRLKAFTLPRGAVFFSSSHMMLCMWFAWHAGTLFFLFLHKLVVCMCACQPVNFSCSCFIADCRAAGMKLGLHAPVQHSAFEQRSTGLYARQNAIQTN